MKRQDKKEIWPIGRLKEWKENPRKITSRDFERLKAQVRKLGQYKPVLVSVGSPAVPDGTVLGGNMRLRAYRDLGVKDVWVSRVSPKTKARAVEYALSDNDRAGRYEEGLLLPLIGGLEIDLADFGVDFKEPVGLDVAARELEYVEGLEVDADRLRVITVEPPEAPRLKERAAFFCSSMRQYEKLRRAFGGSVKAVKLDADRLEAMLA